MDEDMVLCAHCCPSCCLSFVSCLTSIHSGPELEKLDVETLWFMLASHLYWTLWSLIQAISSEIHFGYLEYAHARMQVYFDQKKKLLEAASAKSSPRV